MKNGKAAKPNRAGRWVVALGAALLATTAEAGPGGPIAAPDGSAWYTYYANSYFYDANQQLVGLEKFVDGLPMLSIQQDPRFPGLTQSGRNNLGQELAVAVPDTATYPGSDYYVIGIKEYTERMHSGLPKATKLRGYYQKNAPAGHPAGQSHYLGPIIVAQKDRPVRLKVVNELPTGVEFFIPVDTTIMGAGEGNLAADGVTACDPMSTLMPGATQCAMYSQSRAGVHLHGGFTPWISDGTAHQWIVPAGDPSPYKAGVATRDVPDMSPANPQTLIPAGGSFTLYYPNQQSGRLMFYHDHSYGLTRLNVYGGLAAGYLLTDPSERALTTGVADVPLVIQDKTFVPSNVSQQDTRWAAASPSSLPGDLWFPHVYEANQDPTCAWGLDCMNPLGRWDYGPWIWPPVTLPAMGQPTAMDLTKSHVPESFMDVMVVNGTAYPTMTVEPKAYRLRILNASNDRYLNLQLYYAIAGATFDPTRVAYFDKVTGTVCDGSAGAPTTGCTEVAMVPRDGTTYTTRWGDASTVPFDGRPGGVPDPVNAGPAMWQIGTEGGLLPAAVKKNAPPIPVTYDTDPKSMTVGNVVDGTFILGPAERADVVVDFSGVAPGSRLILYNDAPAAFPAGDQRYDYYTFGPDWTANGGAPSPLPGAGPNTRTVMQIVVQGAPGAAFDFATLQANVPQAYAATQEAPLVPEPDYAAAGAAATPAWTIPAKGQYGKIFDTVSFTYQDATGVTRTLPIHQKAIAEEFDPLFGRMSALLGTEHPVNNNQGQNTFGFYYVDPATEVIPMGETQIWKLTHNGVDTHAIHFHLVNVQVINRVDWAGVVKPPDPNEVGWKETVRMNPLEDILVAVQAKAPKLPFSIPNSTRLQDVTRPAGATSAITGLNFTTPWPYVQPMGTVLAADPGTTTVNGTTDMGWEYVWHCHLLGHEENDMMRPLIMTNVTNYNTADHTAPTVVSTLAPAPNAAGWLRAPATVTITATDNAAPNGAGVASITYAAVGAVTLPATTVQAPNFTTYAMSTQVALSNDGTTTVSATALDNAATPNTGTMTPRVVNIDRTAPTLTATTSPAGVTRGGGTQTVTVSGTVTDALSGVVTGAGTGTYTLTDSKSATVVNGTFNIAANGSYSFTRGISRSNTGPSTTANRRIYTFTVRATDVAGNVGTRTTTFYVQ